MNKRHENVEKSDGVDVGTDVADLGGHGGVRLDKVLYFSYGGEDSGVIPVFKLLADLLQREIGQRAHEIHGNLASFGRKLGSVLAADLLFL